MRRLHVFFPTLLAAVVALLIFCVKNDISVNDGPALLAPMLYSPQDNSGTFNRPPALIWSGVDNAACYEYQVSTSTLLQPLFQKIHLVLRYRNIGACI